MDEDGAGVDEDAVENDDFVLEEDGRALVEEADAEAGVVGTLVLGRSDGSNAKGMQQIAPNVAVLWHSKYEECC